MTSVDLKDRSCSSAMECSICNRDSAAQLGLNCASCARTALYGPRLESARALLERQSLSSRIEAVTGFPAEDVDEIDTLTQAHAWKAELHNAQRHADTGSLRERDTVIVTLKATIENMREEVKVKGDQLRKRKAELSSTRSSTEGREHKQTDRKNDIVLRGQKSSITVHDRSTDSKNFLCREVATLLRLRQRRSRKNDIVREHYLIAGFIVPDLRSINNLKCTVLTTVLESLSQLIVLVAFYLGVRLPCEITLPHRDYPLATINTPPNSYLGVKVPFPGSGSNMSIPSSPASSKYDVKIHARPRPLFVGSDDREELVTHVAKRDPAAFNLFVEATSLLAWNVAWLLHCQGVLSEGETWEDACNIGRNLWHLVFAPSQRPTLQQTPSSNDVPTKKLPRKGPNKNSTNSSLAQFSHSSAHAFLGKASAKDNVQPLKLSKYTMIFDPLRRTLVTEMKNAEWEVLEEDEFDDGGERFDEAVVVKDRMANTTHFDDARSIMTAKTYAGDVHDDSANKEARIKNVGTSGWTKVKSRDSPG